MTATLWSANILSFSSRILSFYVGLEWQRRSSCLKIRLRSGEYPMKHYESNSATAGGTVYPARPRYSRVRFRNVRVPI